jgi:F-type H+-transporting ATPase subunit b
MNLTRCGLRSFALFVLLANYAGPVIFAQDQAAPAEHRQSGEDSATGAQKAQAEPGGQEAAGEENQTEKFKHSSSVRLIGRILGLDSQRSYWIAQVVNFAVIALILAWAGRKYMPGWSRARTVAIQKAMQEAQKASEEARRRLSDIEARLSKLDAEIGAMRASADREAAEEEKRIQSAAAEDARKIVTAAEQEIAAATKAARRELTAHAAELAVALAKKQIRVDTATDQALVRNFAGELGSASNHSESGGESKEGN